ncbi:hypothetical protein ACU8KH_00966 [Lachancea thermotolerans]
MAVSSYLSERVLTAGPLGFRLLSLSTIANFQDQQIGKLWATRQPDTIDS